MTDDLRKRALDYLKLAKAATPGPWKKRDHPQGDLVGCIVEGPKPTGMAYSPEILGEDYTGFGDNEQRAHDVRFIAASHDAASIIRELLEELRSKP